MLIIGANKMNDFNEKFEGNLTVFLYSTDIILSSSTLELLWDSFLSTEIEYNNNYCKRLFLRLITQHFQVRNNLRLGLRNSVKRFGKIKTRENYTNLKHTTEGTIFGFTIDCVLEEL